MRSIEKHQAMLIIGKVRRHPVENYPDAMLVKIIDQVHEIFGATVAAGGSEISRGLVSPGSVEGVLHNGKNLDVSEPQVLGVLSQAWRQFAIGERTVAFFGHSHP